MGKRPRYFRKNIHIVQYEENAKNPIALSQKIQNGSNDRRMTTFLENNKTIINIKIRNKIKF